MLMLGASYFAIITPDREIYSGERSMTNGLYETSGKAEAVLSRIINRQENQVKYVDERLERLEQDSTSIHYQTNRDTWISTRATILAKLDKYKSSIITEVKVSFA